MKKLILCMAAVVCAVSVSYGQASAPIDHRTDGFYQGDHRLKRSEMKALMASNPAAAQYMAASETTKILGIITITAGFGLAGGAFAYYLLKGEEWEEVWRGFHTSPNGSTTSIYSRQKKDRKPNWGLIAVGGVMIVVSIPLLASFESNTNRAVEAYNRGLNVGSLRPKTSLSLAYTGNGVGLVYAF